MERAEVRGRARTVERRVNFMVVIWSGSGEGLVRVVGSGVESKFEGIDAGWSCSWSCESVVR
jgi:hypothetical protein